MSDKSYKGSKSTSDGAKRSGTKSHYEHKGLDNISVGDSKSKIQNSFAGRHLKETEHSKRMGHKTSTDNFPNHEGDGATQL